MTTLFISDLHLSPNNPDLIQLTTEFIQAQTSGIEVLYILGDLFNTWLGDDIIPSEFDPVIDQLQLCHQAGIKIYLMVGNRDFMMGKGLAKKIGGELLGDTCVINLYGTQTLLLHGDTLCIDDVKYQRYRRWTRNAFLQWVFRHLPASYRQRVSDKIKQKSREQKQTKSAVIMDVNQSEVIKVMKQFNVTQLIHGHTHRPAIHHLNINNKPALRIVLGDWDKEISVLKCDNQQCQLIDYRVPKPTSTLVK